MISGIHAKHQMDKYLCKNISIHKILSRTKKENFNTDKNLI